jgi:hypothetical protein
MIANLHLERQCLRTSDPLDTGPKTGAGIGDAITFNVKSAFDANMPPRQSNALSAFKPPLGRALLEI